MPLAVSQDCSHTCGLLKNGLSKNRLMRHDSTNWHITYSPGLMYAGIQCINDIPLRLSVVPVSQLCYQILQRLPWLPRGRWVSPWSGGVAQGPSYSAATMVMLSLNGASVEIPAVPATHSGWQVAPQSSQHQME